MSAVGRESYGVVSGFLNMVRNSANVISLAIATTIVTVTMGSLGFESSLEAVRTNSVEGVRGAFTVGMRYAFYVLVALVIASMVVSFLQGGPGQRPCRSRRRRSRSLGTEGHLTGREYQPPQTLFFRRSKAMKSGLVNSRVFQTGQWSKRLDEASTPKP